MSASRAGMTLVELLIAAAIMVLLLGVLAALLAGTSRAYGSNERLVTSAGQVHGAIVALRHDVTLAGFCGATACVPVPSPLTIDVAPNDGACRDVTGLEVAYVEDRFVAGDPVLRRVSYRLEDRGRLERSVDDGAYVAVADGIEGFQFCGYRTRSDAEGMLRFNPPDAGDLLALEFRLRYRRVAETVAEQRFALAPVNLP